MRRAPPFTDIFAYTDEGGDDETELQKTVISLAQSKNCKINVIWTDVM